ncbi:MAG: hypothetical protein EBU90_11560 [Proteobacteria bacterium]|nr:hypothetical protein [Pseudomonadota bacterium]NBP14616.1 hypothetical protein [bacterium]
MPKKTISKIGDKLAKVNDSFTVNMYDNGFMFEIGGRDGDGDYANVRLMVTELSQLSALVQEAVTMERDD